MSSPEKKITKAKRTRLLLFEAATQNDVETLKQLLDSPKWYRIRDEDGRNLLEIAIIRESKEVFDYLLSLGDFPLDRVNKRGFTALENELFFNHNSRDELYAVELIKKGAKIDGKYYSGSLLHEAVGKRRPRVAQLLIERGADVNYHRNSINNWIPTPLHLCVYNKDENVTELIAMLLWYGADPSVCDPDINFTAFDFFAGQMRYISPHLENNMLGPLEILFYYTVDQWSSLPISTLINLAKIKSPLLHQVAKFNPEIIIIDQLYLHLDEYCLDMFTFDSDYLRILLEYYPYVIKECLQTYFKDLSFKHFDSIRLENFDMLIQCSLRSDILDLISKLNSRKIVQCIKTRINNMDKILKLIYYLLSYGMVLQQRDLQDIYEITGYSEDFKNFLFMDIKIENHGRFTSMMPRLIYDVTLDIHKIVENTSLCDFIDWEEIFHYFVHPKIQNAYHELKPDEAAERRLPQVPLLQELARDAFRKYFIQVLNITTARQFYTLIKRLKISHVHVKILTYETKLY